MGSLIAPFDSEGVLQTHTTSGDSLSSKSGKNKNTVDSDMFLTLLVAEMQNQDPLEPTSNTEWVSQYATFTQVQKMSEMAEAVDVLRANELIGKEVIMKTTSESTGEVSYTQGIVDFVEIENGKPLLVIDDAKYSISDLDTVVSSEYSKAYEKYSTFKEMIDALPDVAFANTTYKNVIQGAFDYYNTMDDYQKNYMKIYGSDQMEKFTEWKLELENMGVKFIDSSVPVEEEPKTSLDDILESFNTKMDAILEKLKILSENKAAEEEKAVADKEAVNKTDVASGDQTNNNTVDQTGNATVDQTEDSNNQSGDKTTDQTGNIDQIEDSDNQTKNVDQTEGTGNQIGDGAVDKTEGTGNQIGDGIVDETESTGSQIGNGTVDETEDTGEQTGDGTVDETESAGSQIGSEIVDETEESDNQTGNGTEGSDDQTETA